MGVPTDGLRRNRAPGVLALIAALVPGLAGSGWGHRAAIPIAVEGGRARFALPTPGAGAKFLVVVAPMARETGPFPIRLSARSAGAARRPERADDGPVREPRMSPPRLDPIAEPPATLPPPERTFHLLVREGDAASAANYAAVPARLRAVGQRVQVYVDERDLERVRPEVLRDLVATFDERVFPASARRLGQARDVDGDGRFTILMTGWLGRLAGGRTAVDGFVRGADLDPGLGPPFGNRCDMMCLNAALESGPHLRTVLAHEYAHAVTFSRKIPPEKVGSGPPREEEGWLDEAMAHLVEDLHGFSRSNLDYRVGAFLAAPEQYRLVVEDYYAADLFRSHGSRGSTYLFLRWCADQFGPDLLPALVNSKERGLANLETATGQTFARLFRRWSVSLYLDGPARLVAEDALVASGPRTAMVRPDGPADSWEAAGTSPHFAIVRGSASGAVEVEVIGPPAARLQVTAVPLPDDSPVLEMTASLEPGEAGSPVLRVVAREGGGHPVELSSLHWAPLLPSADARRAKAQRGRLDREGLSAVFGATSIPPHGDLTSRPFPLPGLDVREGPVVIELDGRDPLGRRVSAWAGVDPPPSDRDS